MKKILRLNQKEQLDLLGDPFCLDILDIMDEKQVKAEWIAQELEEDLTLVDDYLKQMLELGFVQKVTEKAGKELYQVAAESFEAQDLVYEYGNLQSSYWISGFINHLENRLIDFFDYVSELKDPVQFLKDNNYNSEPMTGQAKVYLSKEEVSQLQEDIKKYIEMGTADDRKDNPEYRGYDLFNFIFPHLNSLKKLNE